MFEDIALEVARIERLAFDAVRSKIAAQQLGDAWIGLSLSDTSPSDDVDAKPTSEPA